MRTLFTCGATMVFPMPGIVSKLRQRMCQTKPKHPGFLACDRLLLIDVQGLFGGTCVYIDSTRLLVWIRRISRGCLQEVRSRFALSEAAWQDLNHLLSKHDLASVQIPMGTPVPDEAHPAIILERADRSTVTVGKWASQRDPDFDPVYKHLLRLAEHADDDSPAIDGYDPAWRPPGFLPAGR